MYRRYAIYFTPGGALAKTGAAWLGWDIATGKAVPHPPIEGLNIAALTKRPRKYGLHATIKPPMVLADGTTAEAFVKAASSLAKNIDPVALDALHITQIGRFLALTAGGDTPQLDALAAQFVEALDPFRAPPTPEEIARRRHRTLTASQERNLARWGYPNVIEDFRFHITLTGPIKNPEEVLAKVTAHFAPVLPSPFIITNLIVAGEDADGMFHALTRLPLGR
ncbi:DUF1045 domain-containing protein [uncultured Sulfitobacter sp.]|uniref:DUF1045 domain-containing protein n=1 Tax=uncultured Sulfitobacter sp. TaxID=191468 RepID=UPI00262BA779|nr:DUF1045 domain-containing protein [uncultured Sulfitobacter sp.]